MVRRPQNEARVRRIAALDGLEVLHARFEDQPFPPHFHNTFVIEWVTAGADRCSRADVQARRGELLVHGPRVVHAGESVGTRPLEYRACYPSARLVADLVDAGTEQLPSLGTQVVSNERAVRATARLFSILESSTNEASARAALREVMARVLDVEGGRQQRGDNNAARAGLSGPVRAARDYLDAHPTGDVDGEQLARVAGVTRFHLGRSFKRALGVTPRQYIASVRVARARRMLAEGRPIAEVATRVGFADQSHLTRQFKGLVGLTPGQLRSATAPNRNRVQEGR